MNDIFTFPYHRNVTCYIFSPGGLCVSIIENAQNRPKTFPPARKYYTEDLTVCLVWKLENAIAKSHNYKTANIPKDDITSQYTDIMAMCCIQCEQEKHQMPGRVWSNLVYILSRLYLPQSGVNIFQFTWIMYVQYLVKLKSTFFVRILTLEMQTQHIILNRHLHIHIIDCWVLVKWA